MMEITILKFTMNITSARVRAQIRLVQSMEEQYEDMRKIINRLA